MRLIDTDEILTRIQKAYVDTDLGTNKRAIAINIGLTKALNNVQDCKKIELKKGKWIVQDNPGTGWYRVTCSECGEDVTSTAPAIGFFPDAKVLWDYCPWCGADMRGDTDE